MSADWSKDYDEAVAAERAAAEAAARWDAIKAITAADLLVMDIPIRKTLLTPWLPEAGAAMVYAPRGIGKTFLAMAIAHAVATGGGLLRWQAKEARRVVYVDGEMPLSVIQKRLGGIVSGEGKSPPALDYLELLPADYHRDGLPDIASPAGRKLIERVAEGKALVIFDNLSSLATAAENEGDAWQPIQDLFLSLRRKGISTLLVHHAGKGGNQRGTSRREDIMDTVIALRRPDDYEPGQGAVFTVHFEKSRGFIGADAEPFQAQLITAENGALYWEMSEITQADKMLAMELFTSGDKPADVAKVLADKVSRGTVYRWHKEWQSGGR